MAVKNDVNLKSEAPNWTIYFQFQYALLPNGLIDSLDNIDSTIWGVRPLYCGNLIDLAAASQQSLGSGRPAEEETSQMILKDG